MYTYSISKDAIKGDRTHAAVLLIASHPNRLPVSVEEKGEDLLVRCDVENHREFEQINELSASEKLRYLLNVGELFDIFQKSIYTFQLDPNFIVFDQNGVVKLKKCGILHRCEPFLPVSQEEFLFRYKLVCISVLDNRYTFEDLLCGDFTTYDAEGICQKIMEMTTCSTVKEALQEAYQKEKEKEKNEYVSISKKGHVAYKMSVIILSFVTIVFGTWGSYHQWIQIPYYQTISSLRLAFAQQKYSDVVTISQQIHYDQIQMEDYYLIARAVVVTEPLSDAQKKELLKLIDYATIDYLKYWVAIGKGDISIAKNYASMADDPQLLMYSLTKEIDIIQRMPQLTADQRAEELEKLKKRLDELKKQYLPTND